MITSAVVVRDGRKRRLLAGLVESVQRIPETVEPIAPRIVSGLETLLDSELTVMYRPRRVESGWELELFAANDDGDGQLHGAMASFLAGAPASYAIYDAARPQPAHRNRAWSINPRDPPPGYYTTPIVRELMTDLGLARKPQSRVVVCDGPDMLAWVGGFRSEPYGPDDRAVLAALVAPLRARLKLERLLAIGNQARKALVTALDSMDVPAFLLSGQNVVHANPAGRARLDREPAATRAALAAARGEAGAPSFDIGGVGLPPLRLVLLKPSARDPEPRLRGLATEWRLSPRQLEVLRLVMAGESNKGIAAKLGCVEVTVEFHLGALFRKSGTSRRSELIARCWSLS